ncbi:gliding motility-associated C-terminal domain-containing protein [Christiangramia sp. LLG6405-1]|uniref:T9SS type B sorting domain-containing protein n=1 Tax=Christiangramia sp. LLG6405-1 TaxID=3160832 RepID=UPI00386CF5DE
MQTVNDLRFSDGTNSAIYETADSDNDTDPINGNELLTNGETYFIGSTTEDCTRVSVTVNVAAADTPDNTLFPGRNDFTLAPCISSNFTVADLEGLFITENGYTLEVYLDESGSNALPENQELSPNESYFVGQVSSIEGNCPSTRAAVGYDPTVAPAPNTESAQNLCEGATVADLVATGTEGNTQAIRWYRSMASNSPLADDVELIDGEDYFASQIVNDRNDPFPPCETQMSDRARVIVTLEDFDAGADVTETICQDDLQTRLGNGESPTAVFLSLVDNRSLPSEVSFNPSIASLANDYNSNPFQTFTTLATFTTEEGCEDDVELNLTVLANPDAGENGTVTLSPSDDPINLIDVLNGTPDLGGTWSPGDGTFDPSTDTAGDFTYTVDNGTCSDSATVTVIVEDCQDAAPNNSITFCNDEIDAAVDDVDDIDDIYFSLLPEGTPTDGTFTPTIQQLLTRYSQNNIQDFTTTYSYSEGECDYSVDLTITITEADPANAGSFDNIETVCSNTDIIDLATLTNNDPAANTEGTFTGTGVTNNIFDPSTGAGDYTITYTVADSQPCVTGTETATFTISVGESTANAGDSNTDANIACGGIFSSPATEEEVTDYLTSLLSADADANGTFSNVASITNSINNNLEGPFNSTYTVGEGTSCEDSASLAFTMGEGAIALPDNAITFCNDEIDEAIDDIDSIDDIYFSLLPEGTPTDGTFTPPILDLLGQYNLNPIQDFTTTYSYSEGECDYSADLTITIIEADPANAGSFDNIETVCSNTDVIDLATLTNNDPAANTEGTFTGTGVTNNTFDPSTGAGDYTITYTVADSQPCVTGTETATFTISVGESSANAGDSNTDANIACGGIFSSPATEEEVTDYLTSLLSADADANGTFSNVASITNSINNNLEGPFNSTYTVGEGTSCEDSASLAFTMGEGAIALPDNAITFCNDEIDEAIDDIDSIDDIYFSLLPEGTPTDGTFTPPILDLLGQYNLNPIQDFTTTYSYSEGECDYSADLTITIIEADPANAGSFDNIETVCSNTDVIDLATLTNNDPAANTEGTFTGTGVTNNTFDPSTGAGDYTITYTVADSQPCVTGTETATFIISVQDSEVSTEISRTLCVTEAADFIGSQAQSLDYLQTLIEEAGVEDFDSENYNSEAVVEAGNLSDYIGSPSGETATFTFQYTDALEIGCGDGTISIDITINNLQDAEAGVIEDQSVCISEGMIDLSEFLTVNSFSGGTFTGDNVIDGMFDASVGPNDEGYQITYTVDDSSDCVTPGSMDTADFTITVIEAIDAGADKSVELCRASVETFTLTQTRNFYINLLDVDVPTNGTFEPTIQQIIEDFNNNEDQTAFTTSYTVSNGGCTDNVELTAVLVDEIPAEIGTIDNPAPVCRNAEDVDLFSYLPEGANLNGRFEGYEDGTFSPTMMGEGDFEITYTLTEDSPCTTGEASATFTITVQDAAFAGMDMDIAACQNDGVQNLFDFLSVDADTNGEFTLEDGTVVTDGMMDPSAFDAGTYTVTYTVAAINDCGDDTAEFTITVQEVGDAPVVGDATFCAILDPTGADLTAGNEDLTFYTDANLTMMVANDAPLTEGTYYVTQLGDAGCESAATTFEVSITDPGTPTIEDANQTFCQFDDPTIADLNDAIDQTSNVTWYASADSTDPLSTGTALQDGVTYFASLYDPASDCDSSQRLAVNVSLECDFFIPEGISPNGDQLNDDFEIRYIEDFYPNYTIEIYNRWGDSVYKGNANTPNWDGTSNQGSFGDGLLPVGVYFYYLDFKDGSTEPRRGKVYLSR